MHDSVSVQHNTHTHTAPRTNSQANGLFVFSCGCGVTANLCYLMANPHLFSYKCVPNM